MARRTIPSTLDAGRRLSCRLAPAALCVLVACSGGDSGPSSPTAPTETPTPALVSVSPALLVEGATAVLSGTDFASTSSANVVTIDGVAATVTAATTTQLTVTVPTFDCRPQRTVNVQVSVGGQRSDALAQAMKPADFVDVDVGKMTLIQDPAGFCLQFPPAAAGAGAYLVGIGAAAEMPDEFLALSMTGVMGEAAPSSSALLVAGAPSALQGARPGTGPQAGRAPASAPPRRGRLAVDARMGRWDTEAFDRMRAGGLRLVTGADLGGPARASARVPAVGEQLAFNVPDLDATSFEESCTPTPITTVVRAVGARGIFVTDVANPQSGALTDAEIQELSDAFDAYIYDTDTEYFGTPLDLDQNGRVVVIFTVALNRVALGDGAALVWPGNFFQQDGCAASNVGEVIYHNVPDPDNAAGTAAVPRAAVVDYLQPVTAHEFAHILQFSGRLRFFPNSQPLSPWEMEGQATLATEVVGHRVNGLTTGQDYGANTASSPSGGPWYEPLFVRLAEAYGYDDDTGERRLDTPETCTLFLTLSPGGCTPRSQYGARWSFFRYLADRFGPTWPGGEVAFMKDWISAHPTLVGTANVEALLGTSFTNLMAPWAVMQYVDDRVAGADPALLLTSWNLQDIMPAVGENAPLLPTSRSFSNFTASLSIRGGSTAYSLFDDATPRPAVAISVRDAGGGVPGTEIKPHLWVVRVR